MEGEYVDGDDVTNRYIIGATSLLQAVKTERFIISQIDTIKGYRDTLSNNAYHIKKSRTLPAL